MFCSKISILYTIFFGHHQKLFLLKNIFKLALQYLFNVFMLFNTIFNLKLLKIDQKMRIFKNLEKNELQSCLKVL